MGFGLLITPKITFSVRIWKRSYLSNGIIKVDSREFNLYVLRSTAHINLNLVDCLSVHLEYNKAMNTVYLSRYPSFCAASLPQPAKEDIECAVIHWYYTSLSLLPARLRYHSCAWPASCCNLQCRASSDDITDSLQKMLLSYC